MGKIQIIKSFSFYSLWARRVGFKTLTGIGVGDEGEGIRPDFLVTRFTLLEVWVSLRDHPSTDR